MWLLTTLNHGFAKYGSTYAMTLGKEINECIDYDRKIVDELHKIEGVSNILQKEMNGMSESFNEAKQNAESF